MCLNANTFNLSASGYSPLSLIIVKIKSAKYIVSSPDYLKCPKPDKPEFAFIGRSNVGKSSLINMLCNNSKLAKISSAPGKTKMINHFEIISTLDDKREEKWFLVDLPGYGYAKVTQRDRRRWEQMIENYIRKRENLVCLFVLIDGRHKPQPIDLEFIYQLVNWNSPFVLVFTKIDKNKPGIIQQNAEAFLNNLTGTGIEELHYFLVSSLNKTGRKPLLDQISTLLSNFTHKF